jgi:hypothetical protein
MTRNVLFRGPAPLDPHQAGAELVLTLVLLSQLGVLKTAAGEASASRPRRAPTGGAVARRVRKGQPVRPPRAC